MEDDERFNAGTGAALGLDGETIEMDASVMDTRGKLGAVSCLRSVKNPILVARDVAETPHCLLSGDGAEQFARVMGHAPYLFSSDVDVGLITVSRTSAGACSNAAMPQAQLKYG